MVIEKMDRNERASSEEEPDKEQLLNVRIHGLDVPFNTLKKLNKGGKRVQEGRIDIDESNTEVRQDRVEFRIECKLKTYDLEIIPPTFTAAYTYKKELLSINEEIIFPISYAEVPKDSIFTFRLLYHDESLELRRVELGSLDIFYKNLSHKVPCEGIYGIRSTIDGSNTYEKVDTKKHLDVRELQNLIRLGIARRETWVDESTISYVKGLSSVYSETGNENEITLYVSYLPRNHTMQHEKLKLPQKKLPPMIMPLVYANCIKIHNTFDSSQSILEKKAQCISHSHRRKCLRTEYKPDSVERDNIDRIIGYTVAQKLNLEERDIIWKFRYYISLNKNAFVTFIRCVAWNDVDQVDEALRLMNSWVELSFENVLEALSVACKHRKVHEFIVKQLEMVHDKKLLLYLFHLVQYLSVEESISKENLGPLAKFLISRALGNLAIANYLYWYLKVASEVEKNGKTQKKALEALKSELLGNELTKDILDVFKRQTIVLNKLSEISNILSLKRRSVANKTEKLRMFVMDQKNELLSFPPLFLPTDPNVKVNGIHAPGVMVLKSSSFPFKIPFKRVNGGLYTAIFKRSGDLRLDSFVIETMKIIQNILTKEMFDPCLTLFNVISISPDEGLMQMVPSMALSDILAEYQNIASFLKRFDPNASHDEGLSLIIPKKFMEPYIMSLSSYCVITYLLGIGDRHLDNILLTDAGEIFHIDFSHLFGRDPKFLPPPMKIIQEMVHAMGGTSSEYFEIFDAHICAKYITLRKYAKHLISLLHIVSASGLFNNHLDIDSILMLQDRLKLNNTNEEAARLIQVVVSNSIGSIIPDIMDKFHRFAQILR